MNKKKNPIRRKPHILLLLTKWYGGNPKMPPPDIDQQLSLLECTGLATIQKLYYDEYRLKYQCSIDSILLQLCFEIKPDLIVIALFPKDVPGGMYTPQVKTFKLVKKYVQIPMVAIMTDSVEPSHMKGPELIVPFVDLIVILDSSTAYLKKTNEPEKYFPMWSPRDPRIFFNSELERDIDISFMGSLVNYPDRLKGITALKQSKINVAQGGGATEEKIPIDEYAGIIRRSKIALNFSCSV